MKFWYSLIVSLVMLGTVPSETLADQGIAPGFSLETGARLMPPTRPPVPGFQPRRDTPTSTKRRGNASPTATAPSLPIAPAGSMIDFSLTNRTKKSLKVQVTPGGTLTNLAPGVSLTSTVKIGFKNGKPVHPRVQITPLTGGLSRMDTIPRSGDWAIVPAADGGVTIKLEN